MDAEKFVARLNARETVELPTGLRARLRNGRLRINYPGEAGWRDADLSAVIAFHLVDRTREPE